MMKKAKKLNLSDLKVKSFITEQLALKNVETGLPKRGSRISFPNCTLDLCQTNSDCWFLTVGGPGCTYTVNDPDCHL